jgi:GH43 family beta-xylosidase
MARSENELRRSIVMKFTASACRLAALFLLALATAAPAQVAASAAQGTKQETTFNNPIVINRADAQLYQAPDGYFYFMGTVPEYDRLELRRAKSIEGLGDTAEIKTIWKKHDTGPMGSHIWAPEIHYIDGKWYIYFAAGGAERATTWNIRMYVLENASANPLEGTWEEKGQLKTGWESFALDASTFEHKGTRYLIWAQKGPGSRDNSNLYIAKMSSPTTIEGEAVCISKPDLPWERIGFAVNEGPTVLKKNGRIFLTYSASATDWHYCLGMLTADENANLLDPASWKKSPEPVLKTDEGRKVFGPGHNSFVVLPTGEDVIFYHARNYKEIVGDPLNDPNRHTRAQIVHWNADGTPNFMPPVPDARPVENRPVPAPARGNR